MSSSFPESNTILVPIFGKNYALPKEFGDLIQPSPLGADGTVRVLKLPLTPYSWKGDGESFEVLFSKQASTTERMRISDGEPVSAVYLSFVSRIATYVRIAEGAFHTYPDPFMFNVLVFTGMSGVISPNDVGKFIPKPGTTAGRLRKAKPSMSEKVEAPWWLQ